MKALWCLVISLLLTLGISPLKGQQSLGSIQGQISDKQGQKLLAVAIFIDSLHLGTASDVEGHFLLNAIPAGWHLLEVQAIGYKSIQRKLKITKGQKLILNFQLAETANLLEEITILRKSQAEEKRQSTFTVNVLETKGLQNLSSDLNQVLRQSSGITIREAGGLGSGFKLSLNGLSGNQIRIFRDGIPMENFGSALSLNNFPVNLIESIEVYKGVVPIGLAADALGGAININSSQNQQSFLDAAYSIGSFNTHRLSISSQYAPGNRNFFLRLNAFANYSDNNYRMKSVSIYDLELGNYLGDKEVQRFHSEYQSAMLQFEAGYRNLKWADQIALSTSQAYNFKNYQHPDNNIKRSFGAFHSHNHSQLLSLNYQKKWDKLNTRAYVLGGLSTESIVDTSSYKYNWLGEKIKRANDDPKGELFERKSLLELKDQLLRSNILASYQLHPSHQIQLSASQSFLRRQGQDEVNSFSTSFKVPSHIQKSILAASYLLKAPSGRWNFSLLAKEYWYSGEINSPDEQDQNQSTALAFERFGAGATFSYYLTPRWQIKTSYEKAYRLPEAYEILGDGIYVNANPGLAPEQSDNYNLGLRLNPNAGSWKYSAEFNTFLRNSADFIRFKPLGPFGQYENLHEVRSMGTELSLNLAYQDRIQITVNGTYQDLRDRNLLDEGLDNINYNSRIPNVPYFFSNARLAVKPLRKQSLKLYWSTHYVHEFFLNWENLGHSDSKHIIPSQLNHDLECEYSFQEGRYNLSLSLNNLFDAELYDNFRIQKPGRAIYLKFRYLFKS